MGDVYLATDLHLDRPVAVKVLRSGTVGNEAARKRFRREALALSRFSHPNIATIHDFDSQDDVDFLVMEYVPGLDLHELIKQGPMAEDEIVRLGLQLVSGLDAAHREGILHRDLKPANIRVTPDGHLKILDFGLAKLLGTEGRDLISDTLTRDGRLVGTLAYMAPEQLRGENADERTDVYSAGVLLYEMVTGRRPHDQSSGAQLIDAIRYEEPEPPRNLRPDLSEPLERVILRAIERKREDRHASAYELADALTEAGTSAANVSGQSTQSGPERMFPSAPRVIISKPSAPRTRPPDDGKRRPRVALTGALVVAAIAVGVALWVSIVGIGLEGDEGRPPSWTPRQLTSDQGIEADPAVSPDGTFVAFASDRAGSMDLWLVDSRGGEPLRVTSSDATDRSPAWFPDGAALLFVSDRTGQNDVWKVSRLGGDPVLLVPDAMDPSPSPDGSRLAFSRRDPAGILRIMVADLDDPASAAVITGEGQAKRDQVRPSWSHDGRNVCYTDRRDLWVVEAAGSEPRRLTEDFESDIDPAWSPGGDHIYFSSYREGTQALWRIPAAGGDPERLTTGTGPERGPSLSRDGRVLAYSTFEEEADLEILDHRSGKRLRVAGTREENTPALSPDGRLLVFSSNRQGRYDLWTLTIEEGAPVGEPRRLTDMRGSTAVPAFSPDGRWIAYGGSRQDRWDLWIVPSGGGLAERLTDGPALEQNPAWSPDGSTIAFARGESGETHIVTMAYEDGALHGEPMRLSGETTPNFFPSWSPDGRSVAYLCIDGDVQEICVASARVPESGRAVTTGADAKFVRWSGASGRLLVGGTWGEPNVELRWVSPETGADTPLDHAVVTGSSATYGDFDVSLDERFVVYSTYVTVGDIWVGETRSGSF
jgi:Tol biopolymer transport system component